MPNTEGNILVIDDEVVMGELLKDLLADRGYITSYALSGEEGIKAFKEGIFDVVMVDLKMPDKDGIQVLEEIRRLEPDSAVIVVTGFPSLESVQAALRLGAYDYITKPFNMDDVSFVIKRAVSFRNLTRTNKGLMQELEQQNIKLEEKVRERTKELSLLYRMGLDLSSSLELDEVLRITVDRVCAVLAAGICSILLPDKDTDTLMIRAARGLDREAFDKTRLNKNEPVSGWVLENKNAVLVEDINADPRFTQRTQERYYTHSFISVPLVINDEAIGVINVNNKKSGELFTKEDFRFIKAVANAAAIAVENARLYTSLEDTYLRTVMALTSAIDARDHYTKTHSEHVTKYAVAIAQRMGFTKAEIENIKLACELHDLGKIGVHDYILTKPGKLTPEEWEEVKLHSLKSVEILKPLVFLDGVIDLVEHHHERYDGKGYPHGIKAENIKLGARIIAVADSFDAMTTQRPYRKALSKEEAIAELKACSGTQFDAKVVEVFLQVLKENPKILVS